MPFKIWIFFNGKKQDGHHLMLVHFRTIPKPNFKTLSIQMYSSPHNNLLTYRTLWRCQFLPRLKPSWMITCSTNIANVDWMSGLLSFADQVQRKKEENWWREGGREGERKWNNFFWLIPPVLRVQWNSAGTESFASLARASQVRSEWANRLWFPFLCCKTVMSGQSHMH